ncbi:MAG: SDR family oxidoreductase [Chloroflexi bacterium]|nr:SDR family oxidoreductase [Anaerolineaceae bacterium]NMB88151.1 SDR family oxidoreductase [Chloroflexota bacterium]
MDNFIGKNVLITGGSSGIGLSTAIRFAAEGANVYILARTVEKLTQAAETIAQARQSPSQVVGTIVADVSDWDALSAALGPWIEHNGVPDVLVNSAGFVEPGRFDEQDIALFRSMNDIDYYGTVYASRLVVPGMVQRGSGTIVNISSMLGIFPMYAYTAYCGSKYAVRGFTDALRAELKPSGVNVTLVFPWDTQTPQYEYENQHKPQLVKEIWGEDGVMSADSVAKDILKAVKNHRYVVTPGFEGTLVYMLCHQFSFLVRPVIDFFIQRAWRKVHDA